MFVNTIVDEKLIGYFHGEQPEMLKYIPFNAVKFLRIHISDFLLRKVSVVCFANKFMKFWRMMESERLKYIKKKSALHWRLVS